MLGEVKNGGVARNLDVVRRRGTELVVPVDAEAKPIEIERLGELMIEDPKERNRRLELHREVIVLGIREQRITVGLSEVSWVNITL